MRVAVVGSGPCAFGAIQTIIKQDPTLEIVIIDCADQDNSRSLRVRKTHNGSNYMYDTKYNIFEYKFKKKIYASKAAGGFSLIWGATIRDSTRKYFDSPLEPASFKIGNESCDQVVEQKDCNLREGWTPLNHLVLVDKSKCVMCGNCLVGCDYDAIWNSKREIMRNKASISYQTGFVTRILSNTSTSCISLEFLDGERYEFDRVIIAAGPLATAALLIKSSLIPSRVFLDDCTTMFIPFITLTPRVQGRFGLSQLSFDFIESGSVRINVQIYPDSQNFLIELLSNRIPRKIATKLGVFFSRFVGFSIAYLDTDVSDKIVMENFESDRFVLSKLKSVNQIARFKLKIEALKFLIRKRLLPIPFSYGSSHVGSGYHFGSIKFDGHEAAFKSMEAGGIYMAGTAALTKLIPGPITSLAIQDFDSRFGGSGLKG